MTQLCVADSAFGAIPEKRSLIVASTLAITPLYYLPTRQFTRETIIPQSETDDDTSWAHTARFEAKMDRVFRAIEEGQFQRIQTVDELIEYFNAQEKKAAEENS